MLQCQHSTAGTRRGSDQARRIDSPHRIFHFMRQASVASIKNRVNRHGFFIRLHLLL